MLTFVSMTSGNEILNRGSLPEFTPALFRGGDDKLESILKLPE